MIIRGEREAHERDGDGRAGPQVEVVAKTQGRRFTVEYKRKIVREADSCRTAGAVGALLRRKGLYSSHLTTWRAARERGELAGAPKKRGPAPQAPYPHQSVTWGQMAVFLVRTFNLPM